MSREYREEIAGRLGLEFSDEGKDSVVRMGGGSSFDGVSHDRSAEQMQTTERWRRYADDPLYRSLFQDDELVSLSEEIFGPIPGTEALREAKA